MFQITDSRLKDALDFASDKHAGQLRWGGIPFITHPVAVAAYYRSGAITIIHYSRLFFMTCWRIRTPPRMRF